MAEKSCCCYKRLVFLLIRLLGTIRCEYIHNTRINTQLGSLIGKTEQVEFDGQTKSVTSFLGIPYAKPPVYERRFSRPEPYGDLKDYPAYNATFYRPHCIQVRDIYFYVEIFEQSEDCLYLNIFVPGVPVNESFLMHHFPYPVMVYIHGGSFAVGGADIYAGDVLSAFNDVVVVTINYRLNVFGFLSNGGKNTGNYGLWDMKLALQWIHDHIRDFSGDSDRVTIFGNSAGGAAVLYQAMHPKNRGLFQRVIAQSGSCFAFWAFQDNPIEKFNWFTSKVGCSRGNYSEILNCLRKMPVDDLTLGISKYAFEFVPALDGNFLVEDPVKLSKRQSAAGREAMDFFSELDLLNGVLSQDGAYARNGWMSIMDSVNITGVSKEYFVERYIPFMLGRMYRKAQPVLAQSVEHLYIDWSRPDDTEIIRDKLIDFESDVTFFIPAVHASMKHTESRDHKSSWNNNSYFYVFSHKPDFAPDPEWLTGATHVMELPYIFGFTKALEVKLQWDYGAVDPFITSEEDILFSKMLMTYWTNFAKTGNPNSAEMESDGLLKPIEHSPYSKLYSTVKKAFDLYTWPQYTFDTQRYLELTPNMTLQSVKHHFVASRVAFWENVAPMLQDCHAGSTSSCSLYSNYCVMCLFMLLIFSTRIF